MAKELVKISSFKKENIYNAYCCDCSVASYGQCCCIVMGAVVEENLQNCPKKEDIEKMIYGKKE